eukprot:35052_1
MSNSNNTKRKLGVSVNTQPDTKRRKLICEVFVQMHTKLGDSQQSFHTSDIERIAYFKNQLSSRWNNHNTINNSNDNICKIECNDLYCTVQEIEAIIYYKKHNEISRKYPHDRLIYFCNALSYFAEESNTTTFTNYFDNCIPAITYSNLFTLKQLCNSNTHKKECVNLATAIDDTIKQMNNNQKKRYCMVVENWKTVPLQLLVSSTFIAASVFPKMIQHWNSLNVSQMKQLWTYILNKHAYLHYPQIIDAVYSLNYPQIIDAGYYNNSFKDRCVTVKDIMMDVMAICVANNLKFKQKENYTMIVNIFNMMHDKDTSNITSWREPNRQRQANKIYFHYDYLFDVLKKLLFLRNQNANQFKIHFGENIVVKLLNEKFSEVIQMAEWRLFINDVLSLKVYEQCTKTEQFELLKLILTNYNYISKKSKKEDLQNLIKGLIEIDYEKHFKLTELWFPILMTDHKNWIIKELPNKTALKTLNVLIDGIYAYVVTGESGDNIEQEYFEFIQKYSNC